MEWPQLLESWITPEIALRDWRERIARVEAAESAHFASLPYVRGVAVIGSAGRGNPWPISDLDLLVVADRWEGEDPQWPIRREEEERNKRLHAAEVPNDVEAGEWVLTSDDVRAAVDADEDTFFSMLDDPYWIWVTVKAEGARVRHDFDRYVSRFVQRCNRALWTDRFVELWLKRTVNDAERRLRRAADHLSEGRTTKASLGIALAAQAMTWGVYAAWRRLPQSLSRGVTRFLAAADEMGEQAVGEQYLCAARLAERVLWERFAGLSAARKRERDVWLEIRRRAGEEIDELEATRDLLDVSVWDAAGLPGGQSEPLPAWTGASADGRTVRGQMEAAKSMLGRLREARVGRDGTRAEL